MILGKPRRQVGQVADASLRQAVRQVAVPLSQSRRQAMEAARVAKDIFDNAQDAAPARPGLVARDRASASFRL